MSLHSASLSLPLPNLSFSLSHPPLSLISPSLPPESLSFSLSLPLSPSSLLPSLPHPIPLSPSFISLSLSPSRSLSLTPSSFPLSPSFSLPHLSPPLSLLPSLSLIIQYSSADRRCHERRFFWSWYPRVIFFFSLLTFNSPKRPCSTAPGAIAFLNLSLESQELWALSIEKKGMLFPCHPLVAPPSSLP